MKLFNLENPYSKENVAVTVNVRKYNNGRSALELLEFNPDYGYIPYATATVNMPDVLLADNEVLIKDYAENKGIYDFLIKHNWAAQSKARWKVTDIPLAAATSRRVRSRSTVASGRRSPKTTPSAPASRATAMSRSMILYSASV